MHGLCDPQSAWRMTPHSQPDTTSRSRKVCVSITDRGHRHFLLCCVTHGSVSLPLPWPRSCSRRSSLKAMRDTSPPSPYALRDVPRRPSPEEMTQVVSIVRAHVSPPSDNMSQPLCLVPPPHVWDTNQAACPLPVGVTLVRPTGGLSGIDDEQNLQSSRQNSQPSQQIDLSFVSLGNKPFRLKLSRCC